MMGEQHPVPMKQTHGVPALLSFFIPGLGQLTKGHVGKGAVTFVGFWLFALSIVGIPVALIVWLWNVYDAYNA